MVDPNPARGMPIQLQRYWLVGKGAAKIRWHMPHDFDRCVRNLRKHFPKNPEGLCNILHQKAVGAPPGKGHGHSLTASLLGTNPNALVAAQALLDKQPHLGKYQWAGPIAPIGRPTGEPRRTRIFEPGALYHRTLPLPMDWREKTGEGHTGAVTVGRMLGISYGPDHMGADWAWAYGDYLDEELFPAAKQARTLVELGVAGPSLDPGGRVNVAVNPETGYEHMTQFGIGGITLVSIPAFASMRLINFETDGEYDWPDDDPDMSMEMDDKDCGCGAAIGFDADRTLQATAPRAEFSVNSRGWRGLPLAPRDAVFDNDDAVKRIAAWAGVNAQGADVDKLRRAFMYYDTKMPPTDPTSYRLPFGDIINGKLTLIYHAVYAAAALLSGAHGGLPNVPPEDQSDLRNVISDIYPIMAAEFNDSSIRAPWDRSAQPGVQMSTDATEPYGDVKYADPGYRDNKKRYPIDTPEHIRAAWSYINQSDNANFYDAKQLAAIKARIKAAAQKAGIQISEEASVSTKDEYSSSGFPVSPPKAWFQDPKLTRKTRLTVTEDGHVFGHLAAWNECHRDVTMRECVLAPKSQQGYAPFHLGSVVTAEGEELAVGKIVMDTRHANINLGYTAAALHYDNTGDEIAVIRCGEDEHGIWFSGAIVPEATPHKVAKLRRSPLSGDWRRERGSLELTAALAVNAPAFPVYSIEDNEQMSLTAAGSVWYDDEPEAFTPPTGIIAGLEIAVQDHFAQQQERIERLADILEDDEIYAQRERAARLSTVFAAEPMPPAPAAPAPAAGAPAPAAAPVAAPDAAPVDGQSATDAAGMDEVAWQIAAEADARFGKVSAPGEEIAGIEGLAQATGSVQQAPVAPVAAPVPTAPAPVAAKE